MKRISRFVILVLGLILVMCPAIAFADEAAGDGSDKEKEIIKEGVHIGNMDMSGKKYDDAFKEVESYTKQVASAKVHININGKTAETTLGKLGYEWKNKDVITQAEDTGKHGNVIKRYIDNAELKHSGKTFDISMGITVDALKTSLKSVCSDYNIEAKNASLKRNGNGFEIVPGEDGIILDDDKTTKILYDKISSWDQKSDITVDAVTKNTKAKYTEEDCKKVGNDPMGSFTTYFSVGYDAENRNLNIKNGAEIINGTVLYPGESYSCNEHMAPWTEEKGWHPAGTYVDGEVEDSLGGGICQVSSTLYNALIRAEVNIVERFPHSMTVGYVDPAADAALADDYKDLVFKNNTDAPLYIEGIYQEGAITFSVYGHDTRPEGRTLEFISETVKTIPIETKYIDDPTLPAGREETKSKGHTGLVAKFWKVVYENGVEVSRELLHTTTYKMSPYKILRGTKGGGASNDAEQPSDNGGNNQQENEQQNNDKPQDQGSEQQEEKPQEQEAENPPLPEEE